MTATARRRPRRLSPLLREVGRRLAALGPGPRGRRLLALALVVAVVVAGLYMFLLRDSGLVGVDRVEVSGLTGGQAERARKVLGEVGEQMTTLHVDHDRLDRAVAPFPAIRALAVDPDFPHTLKIHVLQRRPVAMLQVGSRHVPIAGDGSILAGSATKGELPTLRSGGPVPPRRLGPGTARDAALLAGEAPPELLAKADSIVRSRSKGLVVELSDDGPQLIFGDRQELAAKWRAASRVLADSKSSGARYIDVRLAARPVAGGLPTGDAGSQPEAATAPPTETPQPAEQGVSPAPTETQP